MIATIKIAGDLLDEARKSSRIKNRSLTRQIVHWVKIGKLIEDNPDLTYNMIKDMMTGLEGLDHGKGIEYTLE